MNRSWHKKFYFLISLLILHLNAASQNVINLSTQILPPFTPYWTDYLSDNNKLILLVSNNVGDEAIDLRLTGQIVGNNGIILTIPPDYIPPFPITVMPRQTIKLTGPQLINHLNLDIFQITGTTLYDLRTGNGLPEGNYQLCLRAVEYSSGRFLSMPEPLGCTYFNIRQLEPPIILQPVCGKDLLAHEATHTGTNEHYPSQDNPAYRTNNTPPNESRAKRYRFTGKERDEDSGMKKDQPAEDLKAEPDAANSWGDGGVTVEDGWRQQTSVHGTYPQNILFSWTVPAGANPANTEYVLTIVEMYPQDIDPNQAIQVANDPVFFQKVVQQNVYLYNQADPFLEKGRKYAFRVTARPKNRPGSMVNRLAGTEESNPIYRNNGHSEACYFIYGSEKPLMDPLLAFDTDSTPNNSNDSHDRFANQEVNYIPVPDDDHYDTIVLGKDSSTVAKKSEFIILKIQQKVTQDTTGIQIGNTLIDPPPDPIDYEGCDVEPVTNTNPASQINPGNIIQVGNFQMEVDQVSKNTFPFSGTGQIAVNFLNTQINVEFNELAINNNLQVFDNGNVNSYVRGHADHNVVQQNNQTDLDFLNGLNSTEVSDIMNLVQEPQRSVSNLSPDQSIGLPVGLDKGPFYTIAIVGMNFKSDGASLNALLSLEVSEAVDERINLTAAGVCFNPEELGNPGKLILQEDLNIELSPDMSMVIEGGEDDTYSDWSLTYGYQETTMVGRIKISENSVASVGNPQVEAFFETSFQNFNAWTTEISFNGPFYIPYLEGFEISVGSAIFDHSDLMNVPGTSLPADHGNYMETGNAWRGILLEEVSLTLPGFIQNNGNEISFLAENMIIDKTGLSGNFQANNLLSLANGEIDNWPFSIESFQLNIIRSSLNAGSFAGNLRLPVSATEIEYTTTLSTAGNGLSYQFVLEDALNLNLPLWLAEMNLENSSLGIEINGSDVTALANLNGELSIDWGTDSPMENMKLLNMSFNNFKISGASLDLSETIVDFSSSHEFLFFPIRIQEDKSITLDGNEGGKVSIRFPLEILLDGHTNGVGASTTFSIYGKYSPAEKLFIYDDFVLEKIGVDADLGLISFKGEISKYDNHDMWGSGFTGKLTGEIPGFGLKLALAGQFGSTGYNHTGNYRYWYVDAKVYYLPGFNIPTTPLSIYGFGGGAYRNMTRIPALQTFDINDFEEGSYAQEQVNNIDLSIGETLSGAILEPAPDMMGLKAELVMGLSGIATAMNCDLGLGFEFPTGGEFGGGNFILEGKAYVMTPIDDREKGYVQAEGKAVIEGGVNPNYFSMMANVDIDISVAGITLGSGGGQISFIVTEGDWYLKIGDYTPGLDPFLDDNRIFLSAGSPFGSTSMDFRSYFVAGKDVYTGAPGLPAQVMNAVSGNNVSGGQTVTDADQEINFNEVTSKVGENGFAFGAAFGFKHKFNYLLLYAQIEAVLGADLAMLDKGEYDCYLDENNLITSVGVNDWYATGSAYGYLGISGGIGVDVWFFKGQIEFFSAGAGFLLNVEMPNPYYLSGKFGVHGSVLKGLIKINQDFHFEYGKPCQWVKEKDYEPFDLDIITDLQPTPSDKNPPSIFSYPEAAFNFQLDKIYSFTDEVTGDITKARIDDVDLSLWRGNTRISVRYRKASNGHSAWIMPEDVLEGKTSYTFKAGVTGYVDYPNDGKGFIPAKTEKKEITFTTGPEPKHIVLNNVKYTYPFPRQRYFLKDMQPTKGRIELLQGRPNLFSKTPGALPKVFEDDPVYPKNAKFQQLVRFTELETGRVFVAPLTYNNGNKTIVFDIAPQLKNEVIYSLEIINRFDAEAIAGTHTQGDLTFDQDHNILPGQQAPQIDDMQTNEDGASWTEAAYRNIDLENQTPYSEFGGLNQLTVMAANDGIQGFTVGKQNDKNQIQLQEMRLTARRVNYKRLVNIYYQHYFRTSRFNTAQEKMNTFKVAKTYYEPYSGGNGNGTVQGGRSRILLTTGENLDVFEAYGAKINNNAGSSFIDPLISLTSSLDENWFQQIKARIYTDQIVDDPVLGEVMVFPAYSEDRYFNYGNGWLTNRNYSAPPEEALRFYRYSLHGPIGLDLPADEQIWQPDRRLTDEEIEIARKKGEPAVFVNNGNFGFTMVPDVQTPGNPFGQPGVLAGTGGGGTEDPGSGGGSASPWSGGGWNFGKITNYLPILFYVDMVGIKDFLTPQPATKKFLLHDININYQYRPPYHPLPFRNYRIRMKYQHTGIGTVKEIQFNYND
jgi:hypothetical protein